MRARSVTLALWGILLTPKLLLACGGCTDVALLMTRPWVGYGIVLVWAWIVAALIARWRSCNRTANGDAPLVRSSTLATFAILGSAGYAGLVFLTMGSLLLPSLCIGFVWSVYLGVRFLTDLACLASKNAADTRPRLLLHGVFLLATIAIIVHGQLKVPTLDHCIGCLGYGRQVETTSLIMPRIVAMGPAAVSPLTQAIVDAVAHEEYFTRGNMVKHGTFCLARIGGPDAEKALAELVAQNLPAIGSYDLAWYQAACYAYARCAGARAADDLVTLFAKVPVSEYRDARAPLLVALVMTNSKNGVNFAIDHLDVLFAQARASGDACEVRVIQAALERLVFPDGDWNLADIPAFRDRLLCGDTWLAKPRPNDYTSEFFWTEASEKRLRAIEDLEAAWKENAEAIRKQWAKHLH